jgi:hypothetical protein
MLIFSTICESSRSRIVGATNWKLPVVFARLVRATKLRRPPSIHIPGTHKLQRSPTLAVYRYLLLLTLLITCQSLLLLVPPAGIVEGDHPGDHPRRVNAAARSLAEGLLVPSSLAAVSRQLHRMVVASHASLLSTRLRQLQWWWI